MAESKLIKIADISLYGAYRGKIVKVETPKYKRSGLMDNKGYMANWNGYKHPFAYVINVRYFWFETLQEAINAVENLNQGYEISIINNSYEHRH